MVNSDFPNWAKKLFCVEEIEQISQAIRNAEKQTSAEIVPIIVRESATRGHVLPMSLLIFAGLSGVLETLTPLPWYILLILVVAPAFFLARFGFWVRFLTSQDDLNIQASNRAAIEFYENGLHQTQGSTGVLVFVSLMEHEVIILADKTISSELPANTWNHLVQGVVQFAKDGKLALGLEMAIKEVGQKLSEKFPRASDDVDELPNRLKFLE